MLFTSMVLREMSCTEAWTLSTAFSSLSFSSLSVFDRCAMLFTLHLTSRDPQPVSNNVGM